MNTEPVHHDSAADPSVFDPEMQVVYSIDVVASLAGLDSVTVLHFQEMGIITPAASEPEPRYDDEALRRLRRIVHLREACGVNDAGIGIILPLLDEIEALKEERRLRFR